MSLELYIGPMFSGKTGKLLKKLTRCADLGIKVLYINHQLDVRDKHISSHSSQYKGPSSKIDIIKIDKLRFVDVINHQVIGIDESQFFDDLKEIVINWVEKQRKTVYVAGLDGDYLRVKFGQILDLIPYSSKVKKFNAYCRRCLPKLNKAPFTACVKKLDKQIVIGGEETYIPLCREHYLENII